MIKFVLQLACNAEQGGFRRSDVFELLEQSLPVTMTKTQKLNYITNMLKAIQASGWLTKNESGKRWLITTKGMDEFRS